jgi:hypothetical protein
MDELEKDSRMLQHSPFSEKCQGRVAMYKAKETKFELDYIGSMHAIR